MRQKHKNYCNPETKDDVIDITLAMIDEWFAVLYNYKVWFIYTNDFETDSMRRHIDTDGANSLPKIWVSKTPSEEKLELGYGRVF